MFGDVNQIEASGNVSSVPAFPPAFSGDKISSAFSQRFWDIAARLTFAADDAPPSRTSAKSHSIPMVHGSRSGFRVTPPT